MCKQRILCYADEDDEDEDVLEEYKADETMTKDISHIHAMDGGCRSQPLKVVGSI